MPFAVDDAALAKIFRDALPKAFLFRSVAEAYAAFDTSRMSDEDTIALVERCPSLGVFARVCVTYYHSLFGAALKQRRAGKTTACVGKPSDFGDLMHTSYAPYVDVFRCDGHFGELLKQDTIVRSKIVSKRSALSAALNTCIADTTQA